MYIFLVSKQKLHGLLNSIVQFPDSELELVLSCFYHRSVQKGSIILRHGEICHEFYFVERGCLRTYFIDQGGDEKTRLVLPDPSIGTALTSFISQEPSFESIDALEESSLYCIDHRNFYELIDRVPHWHIFYTRILEMAYAYQNQKIEDLVTLSATQRYNKVLTETPQLVNRLPNKILASYLDIKPETLSRLKSISRRN